MNFLEMKTRVRTYSGERDADKAGYAVNDALNMIHNAIKWPWALIPGTALTLVAGTQQYSLPSNFKFPHEFWYRNSSIGRPQYILPATRKLDSVNTGTPQWYRVKKAAGGSGATKAPWYVDFEEIPSGAFIAQYPTIEFDYYYKPADLSGDTDVPQLDEADHPIIVWGAVTLLTAKQDDQGAFQMFASLWEKGYQDIIQNAIDFYGEGVIVAPGEEITGQSPSRISDYGRVA